MSGQQQPRKSRGAVALTAALAFLLLPAGAQAHTPIKGAGDFVSGFLHPFFTPTHLLLLLGLGLLLGQRQPLRLQWPLLVFAASATVGLLVAAAHTIGEVNQPVLIALGLCVGSLVALAAPLPSWVRLAACAASGLTLGLDSGVDAGTTGVATARTLVATWASLMFCLGDIAFYSSRLPPYQWVQTGVRIAGSWMVAIAVLMLAFALRR